MLKLAWHSAVSKNTHAASRTAAYHVSSGLAVYQFMFGHSKLTVMPYLYAVHCAK